MAAVPAGTGGPAWTPEAAAAAETPLGRRARGRPGDRPSGKVAWSAAKGHPAMLALNPALMTAPAPASSSAPASARPTFKTYPHPHPLECKIISPRIDEQLGRATAARQHIWCLVCST